MLWRVGERGRAEGTRMRRALAIGGLLVGVGIAVRSIAGRRAGRETAGDQRRFEPEMVARLEVAGWRAYYEHAFGKGLIIMLRLMGGLMGAAPLGVLRAAYYALRGQMAYAGERGER